MAVNKAGSGSKSPVVLPRASVKRAGTEPPREPPDDNFSAVKAPPALPKAQVTAASVPHTWAAELRKTAVDTAAELKAAGAQLHAGADALEVVDPVGIEAHALGTHAHGLGTKVESLADASQVPAGAIHAEAHQLQQRADGLIERVSREETTGARRPGHALAAIGEGVRGIGRAVRAYTQGIARALDYEKNIDLLGPGDSYTLSLEGFVMGLGIELEGAGSIQVERDGGTYKLTTAGEAGAGIFVDFGFKVFGVGIDAFAAAVAGRGNELELSFATADEAKRAMKLMLSRVGKKATFRAPTPEEQDLLRRNLSAVVLRGHSALEGWAFLGLGPTMGAISEGNARTDRVLRVELGSEPALVASQASSVEINTTAGAAPRTDEIFTALAVLGNKTGVLVETTRRVPLSKDVDLSAFQDDPKAALRKLKERVDSSHAEESVNVSLETKGGLFGSGGGFGMDLSLGASIDEIKKSGAVGRVLKGDLVGALEKLPPSVAVEASFETFSDYGVDIGPTAFFLSFGGGLQLEAMRKDVDWDGRKVMHGDAHQAADSVTQWASGLKRSDAEPSTAP